MCGHRGRLLPTLRADQDEHGVDLAARPNDAGHGADQPGSTEPPVERGVLCGEEGGEQRVEAGDAVPDIAFEAAIEAGGEGGIDGILDDVVLANAAIGLDAWSPMGFALGKCIVHLNGLVGDREFAGLGADCVDEDPGFGDLTAPAGPDGRFFTADDPWVSAVGGARVPPG